MEYIVLKKTIGGKAKKQQNGDYNNFMLSVRLTI